MQFQKFKEFITEKKKPKDSLVDKGYKNISTKKSDFGAYYDEKENNLIIVAGGGDAWQTKNFKTIKDAEKYIKSIENTDQNDLEKLAISNAWINFDMYENKNK